MRRNRHKELPFFLYLTFNAVHTPMHATQKYLEKFAAIQDERRRTYAAMTAALDENVGRVLDKLRDAGLEENTLIFYVSDNGGPQVNGSDNVPLRGYKAQRWKGASASPSSCSGRDGSPPASRSINRSFNWTLCRRRWPPPACMFRPKASWTASTCCRT